MTYIRAIIETAARISDASAAIAAAIMPILVLSMVWEVVARYLFNAPTAWAYEVSYMLMGAAFVLSIAYALKAGYHVHVDFIYARLSDQGRAVVDIVGYCLLLPVVWWMAIRLALYALTAYQSGEVSGQSAWNPVVWPFRSILAVGFVVFGLQATAKLLEAVSVIFGAQRPET